ncbi:DUF6538 domain-containing protein [Afipia massiliensis]|uniref:DUF6538 domain-containing protein n=1 Tax=Afipia massiliensis TaxID=211460 RepID=UPI003D9AD98E
MPLAMSRPWKHPDSGVYWFRRGVPADLRALVGKRREAQPSNERPCDRKEATCRSAYRS